MTKLGLAIAAISNACNSARRRDERPRIEQRPTTQNNQPTNNNPEKLTKSCHEDCYAKEWPCPDCYNKCMQQCE